MTIYKTIVEPILMYGAECWQLKEKDKRKINAVEMDYLRRSCRISRQEHIQNEQIRRRTRRVHTTVERVETRQLVWYGHVKRMSDDRWPKRALEYIPPSRRRRGRPAQTWMSGIMLRRMVGLQNRNPILFASRSCQNLKLIILK
ncbi:hypothetical protein RN001_007287 [Aquatica leii]|uniref:Endonuclease-reverse transcriptase n=1 Tax=Aquatica leii TaxID=1421715 RepID=A0AAN7PCW7_9COLE|nr:hypothetical protein RN001_007287 [Aquatica leii]